LKTPLILEVKGNALDDGPGIRSVVFFKGCPLSCVWCHNPEGKRTEAEIGFDAEACVACDTCLTTCPCDALDRHNPFFIDRRRCNLCFECVEKCPSGALARVGHALSVEDILARILKDKIFYDNSGGGVTFSGGEPTLFMEFAAALLQRLKAHNIHILLETCGLFDWSRFKALIYPWLDTIYFDIKLMDSAAHRTFCGASNAVILENFRKLYALSRAGGVDVLPRTPLIPGITDTEANLQALAEFLCANQVSAAKVLPYHPLWRAKEHQLGGHGDYADRAEMQAFLKPEQIEACKTILRKEGIRTD
jgi:pyruvate formate lyase activating enzyme